MMRRMGHPIQHGLKYQWRFRWRGKYVKVSGYPDLGTTKRMGQRIDELAAAVQNGDPLPRHLMPWIAGMKKETADRLIKLGVLEGRYRQACKPMEEHIDSYRDTLKARKNNTEGHAIQQAARVRRVAEALKMERVEELTVGKLLVLLKGWDIAPATRRHYMVALHDFTKWMVKEKRTLDDPLADIQLPPADEDETVLRRPLTLEHVRTLFAHLDSPTAADLEGWTGPERKLLYWTAIKTGLRARSLLGLTRADVLLEQKPAMVQSLSRFQKNKRELSVPIGSSLAAALRAHLEHHTPQAKVFRVSVSRYRLADTLRADLEAAGVPTSFPRGDGKNETVDFHTLRATAITHWLVHDRIDQLTVARLAGLKTLRMVQRYARNFRVEEYPWLAKEETLEGDNLGRAMGTTG